MPVRVRAKKPKPELLVSGALAVVLRMCRYAGLAPLTLCKDGSGWRVSFSPIFNIYGYCLVTVLNVCIYIAMFIDLSVNPRQSIYMQTPLRRIVRVVDLHLGMAIASVSVYGARRHINAMISCLNGVQKVHSQHQVHRNNWSHFTERQIATFAVIWTVHTAILLGFNIWLLSVISDFMNPEDVYSIWMKIVYSSYYCSIVIVQLQMLQFSIIALHVLYAFRAINTSLRDLIKDNSSKSEQLQFRKIRSLRSQYSIACAIVRDISRCYGLTLLLILGSILLHLILSPYYLFNTMTDKHMYFGEIPYNSVYLVLQLVWILHHATNLMMIIEPCHNTQAEMKTTRKLVSELMVSTRSIYEPEAEELELFHRCLLVDHTSYSPLGVTTLTRSVVLAIFSSVTTYLVILLQL